MVLFYRGFSQFRCIDCEKALTILPAGSRAYPVDSPNPATARNVLALMAWFECIDDSKPVPVLVDDEAETGPVCGFPTWYGQDAIDRLGVDQCITNR